MKFSGILFFAAVIPLQALSQHVADPHASVVSVASRQTNLKATNDPLLREAIAGLSSCVATPLIPAPTGRINIPRHYLNGSSGPTNPAEAAATRVYSLFEERITAGMNQYVATGSHAESACALAQLDAWAQGHALLDYDRVESPQAWYQVEWTLSAAGITDSVLVNDTTLDQAQQQRQRLDWLAQIVAGGGDEFGFRKRAAISFRLGGSQLNFDLLAQNKIVDVGAGAEPFLDLSVFISQRYAANQPPAVFSVRPA